MKKIEDATELRRRLLLAFENAENTEDANARRDYLAFVIVGGGPTEGEPAGAMAELPRKALQSFKRLGVEVRLNGAAEDIDENGVVIAGERIDAKTVFWAAGVIERTFA